MATEWPFRNQQAPDYWDEQLRAYVDEHDQAAQETAVTEAVQQAQDAGDLRYAPASGSVNYATAAQGAKADTASQAADTRTSELISRMQVRPTRARRTAIRTLISSLMTADIWDRLDGLYIMAAHSAQAAQLNWVGMAQDLTLVNSPIFQLDRGFTGDGTTGYMDLGVAANAMEKFQAEDATMGVYVRTNIAGSAYIDMNAGGASYINPASAGNTVFRANTSSGSPLTPSNGGVNTGLFAWSRLATTAKAYRAGAQIGADQTGLGAGTRAANNVLLMRDSPGTNYSSRQQSAAFIGGNLTSTQHASLYAALQAYMTSVGANV